MFKRLLLSNKALLKRLTVKMGDFSKYTNVIKAQQIDIGGQTINYIKHGNGNHNVLCFPGALGTIWSDFSPQIENFDTTKFTLVVWDPPGYGRSRPPNRTFPKNFFERDGDIAFEFMKKIGIKKYSLLGWSDGGISSIFMAAKYPETIKKLVIWGANAYVIAEEIKICEKMRDIGQWSDRMKAPLIEMYGEKGLHDMWNGWCDTVVEIFNDDGNICKHQLSLIKCPTFILHGNKDPMVAAEHPNYLISNIKHARFHRFPEGKHNIHLRYAAEFNELVMKFLEMDDLHV